MFSNLPKEIKALRKRKGLTQLALGVKAGVNPCQISRIENGDVNVRLKTLERIAKAASVTVELNFREGVTDESS